MNSVCSAQMLVCIAVWSVYLLGIVGPAPPLHNPRKLARIGGQVRTTHPILRGGKIDKHL